MKRTALIFIFIILLGFVNATCSDGQININTATLNELDNLSGIGPAKAQAIIDARPFNSVDDLINVKGIGSATLDGIKAQGLACVDNTNSQTSVNNSNSSAQNNPVGSTLQNSQLNSPAQVYDPSSFPVDNINPVKENSSPIYLSGQIPKDIKSSNTENNSGSADYSKYSLVVFCVLLGALYLLKPKKKKNEFKK